ncbi:MAG: hypothetical protein VST70_01095 [Nitrospirota bacterium]|nr:hypothetical protein [Nitrospirota bacterium]
MGYVQYMSEKIRAEIDRLEAIIFERMEQMMKRTRKKTRRSKRS